MKNETVDKIEDNLRKAQNLVEETARLLCNEPGNTLGGQMWRELAQIAEKVAEPLYHTYQLRD